jgi:hypothetical protein
MAALSKAVADSSSPADLTEPMRLGPTGPETSSMPLTVASQIDVVISLAQAQLDLMQKAGVAGASLAYMSSALSMVKPLLAQYINMMSLLIKAGVEINGNPFLDEDTVLPEIRSFLSNKDLAGILHEAIPAVPEDQVEILEDLISGNLRRRD